MPSHGGGGSGLQYMNLEGDRIQPVAAAVPILEGFPHLRGKSLIHT